MPISSDIVIIGGGVIGSSIAFNLFPDGFKGRITVMERDPSYQFASSAQALGGVRQQFMSSMNVGMVQYSLKAIEGFPECQFRRRGYLFLGDESNWPSLQRRYEIQKSLGAECELLSIADIRRLVPELLCDDLLGGLLGPQDGYVDPRATLRAFRAQAWPHDGSRDGKAHVRTHPDRPLRNARCVPALAFQVCPKRIVL